MSHFSWFSPRTTTYEDVLLVNWGWPRWLRSSLSSPAGHRETLHAADPSLSVLTYTVSGSTLSAHLKVESPSAGPALSRRNVSSYRTSYFFPVLDFHDEDTVCWCRTGHFLCMNRTWQHHEWLMHRHFSVACCCCFLLFCNKTVFVLMYLIMHNAQPGIGLKCQNNKWV